jgi:hypothetical protein
MSSRHFGIGVSWCRGPRLSSPSSGERSRSELLDMQASCIGMAPAIRVARERSPTSEPQREEPRDLQGSPEGARPGLEQGGHHDFSRVASFLRPDRDLQGFSLVLGWSRASVFSRDFAPVPLALRPAAAPVGLFVAPDYLIAALVITAAIPLGAMRCARSWGPTSSPAFSAHAWEPYHCECHQGMSRGVLRGDAQRVLGGGGKSSSE